MDYRGTGTHLRHVLDLLDAEATQIGAALVMPPDYRPRFAPPLRALAGLGPMSIRELAEAIGVTHSAASQTVAQLLKASLVTLTAGTDARQRIVSLTQRGVDLIPMIESEWEAVQTAMTSINAELSIPLDILLTEVEQAIHRRPLHERTDTRSKQQHPG